jgi:hypothetical protein
LPEPRVPISSLALLGEVGDHLGFRPGHATSLFDALQVFAIAVTLFNRPLGAAAEHRIHLLFRQADVAGAAEPGGDHLEQTVGQAFPVGFDIGKGKSGVQ